MFIELTEYLRCPEPHDESYCVLAPDEMVGRVVRHGSLGCPICHREYAIVDGIVEFGGDGWTDAVAVRGDPGHQLPEPQVVQALIGLASPGGYVLLVGSATRLIPSLAQLIGGVHFVGVNPPPDVQATPVLSLLRSATSIPVKTAMRGVVLGSEHALTPWLDEARRVLLKGQRLVILDEHDHVPALERLAVGQGLWVGEKQ